MWRGTARIIVSPYRLLRVGTGLVQDWHAKILTSGAVNIYAQPSPSSDCEGQSSVPGV